MTKKDMTLTAIQTELDEYIGQFKEGYFPPLSQLARLTEEVGELSREISHTYGDLRKKTGTPVGSLSEEIGDVLIALVIMANSLNLDLEQIYYENMKKFRERDKERFERIDGRTKNLRDENESQ